MKRFLLYFLTIFSLNSNIICQNKELGINKIVIDPGHGGKDPGNIGTGRYHKSEKDVVLDVSKLLGKYLVEAFPSLEVIYTRQDDRFVKLSERTRIANDEKADLFLSIHCDAFDDKKVFGSTTYVMGVHKSESNLNVAIRENSSILLENNYQMNYEGFNPSEPESYIALSMYQTDHLNNSLLLATKIQNQFRERVSRKDRGVKQAGFMVISRATMPSVLVELGFLTNYNEEDFLHSKSGKIYMASAIFRAIKDYKIELETSILENYVKKPQQELVFSVQFLSSVSKISISEFKIENKDKIFEFNEKNLFKYSYGQVKSLEEVKKLKEQLGNYGFSDTFTIAILNGSKISLSDALLILK